MARVPEVTSLGVDIVVMEVVGCGVNGLCLLSAVVRRSEGGMVERCAEKLLKRYTEYYYGYRVYELYSNYAL